MPLRLPGPADGWSRLAQAGLRLRSAPQIFDRNGTMAAQYEDPQNVTIAAVDMTKALLFLSGGVVASRPLISGQLTAPTNALVTVQNIDNVTSLYAYRLVVAEFENIEVQRGTLSYSCSAATYNTAQTVSINPVPLDRGFPVPAGAHRSDAASGGTGPAFAGFCQSLINALAFSFGNADASARTIVCPWQIARVYHA
ncbi:MAG: hypothetical protein C4525_03210 [Desulfarculus sp.]|jgi:hypothetical protein|nr:MAG: hypothetical protein C4525_03210 [Desulfarculus sp.]